MRYVYENFLNEFDWFLYVNDETYVIVENLRYFLADKCSNEKNVYGFFGDNKKSIIDDNIGFQVEKRLNYSVKHC